MNTNEEMIFDELMRQKLGNYSETPDMALMNNIHAKKNRIIKLYRLGKMFTVICIIGLSLFGTYMLLKPTEQDISQNSKIENRVVSVISNSNNAASKNYNNSSAITSTNSRENINSLETITSVKPIRTTTIANQISSTQLINKVNIQSISTPKNSIPNNNQATNFVKKDSIVEKQNEKKDKSNDISKNCKAAFDYYVSYDGKYNFTNFSDAEVSSKMLWNFGDGTSSEIGSPNHAYKNNGNYIVTLKLDDISNSCSDVLQKNITFNSQSNQQNNGISIKGNVIAGSDEIKKGTVFLMIFNTDKNSYSQFLKTTISLSGEYNFTNLKTGTYMILADVSNPKYVPTYWGNTSDVNEAVQIHIMDNDVDDLLGLNISLINNKDFNNNYGARIFTNDTFQNYVLVMDQNNNVVGKAKVDNNGNVNLSGFPPGNYQVMNPQSGNTNPVKVLPGEGYSNGGSVGFTNGNITLIPNPAINDVKFTIQITNDNESAEVIIMNVSGSMVFHKNYVCSVGSFPFDIDISTLPPGNYYVLVNVGGTQTLSGRLIKSGNNNSMDNR